VIIDVYVVSVLRIGPTKEPEVSVQGVYPTLGGALEEAREHARWESARSQPVDEIEIHEFPQPKGIGVGIEMGIAVWRKEKKSRKIVAEVYVSLRELNYPPLIALANQSE